MAVPEAARAGRFDVTLELGILLEMQGEAARATDILNRIANDPTGHGRRTGDRERVDFGDRAVEHTDRAVPIRAAERGLELLTAPTLMPAIVPDLMGLTTSEMLRR